MEKAVPPGTMPLNRHPASSGQPEDAGYPLGVIASIGIARSLQWATVVSPFSVLLAFGVATAVGVFFGWYPARQAARLDPIEALRHE